MAFQFPKYTHPDFDGRNLKNAPDAAYALAETDGILWGCVKNNVPFVLAGSIRDDGPLPEVISDAYVAASKMRKLVKKATNVQGFIHKVAKGLGLR